MTVLCKEVPKVTMVNPLPPGAKGLAASRWATPTPTQTTKAAPTPTPTTKPTAVLCKEVPKVTMARKDWPHHVGPHQHQQQHSLPLPPTPAVEPTPTRVLCKEVPKVKMVNTFPPGAKGLATSRWATPTPTATTTQTTPIPTPTTKPTPTTVLCKEVQKVTMVNPFPPGAKGLAASRWA
ncbi:hypothetical protein V8F33_014118 [Rhypophila sp. PSN 637]